ncbi:MAG TPA: DUF1552 domain-containing protein [Polyangia bacterium]
MFSGECSLAAPPASLFPCPLAGMLNGNGTAYAAGAAMPVRFGVWFFGNGIIPNRWVPARVGVAANWDLSEELLPLQALKPYMSVVTGLTIKVPNNAPHSSMPSAALSGTQVGSGGMQSPSIDQLIAKAVDTPSLLFHNGLHVGNSNHNGATALDRGISYTMANSPNPPNYSPAALYKQLVQFATTGGMPKPVDPELLNRKMVLDAVLADANALHAKLGKDDQMRLDLHLTGLNQLQQQVLAAEMPKATGMIVDPDKAYPTRGSDNDNLSRKRGQAFADLLVFAMASDLTRVFSFLFSAPASHGAYVDCGLDSGSFHEDYGHRNSQKGVAYATTGFNNGVRFAMSNLADILSRMKETPDGAGNLLDNSCVYTTSCVSESQTHSGVDFPILVAGKAGGKIKGDQHIRVLDDNVSKVPFTLLNAMGGAATSFGTAEGQVTTGISALLA